MTLSQAVSQILTWSTFLVFLVLKLTGYIAWSWWWVTAPLWGIPALLLTIVAFALGAHCIVWITKRLP